MEIRDILHIARKWWVMIALLVFVAVLGSGAISYYFLQNMYESSSVMIIASPQDKQAQTQLTLDAYMLNTKLVDSYKVLCKTDRVLNQVMAETKLPMTLKALSDEITISAENDTEYIRITVQDKDPNTAARIANVVATVFAKEVQDIMRMDNVKIIDNALPNSVPVKPDRIMIIAVAGLLGFMLGIGIAFLIEYFDVTIKSSDQLAELVGAPVLGTIPHMLEKASRYAQ